MTHKWHKLWRTGEEGGAKEKKRKRHFSVLGERVGSEGAHHHSVGTPAPIVPYCKAETPPVPWEPPLGSHVWGQRSAGLRPQPPGSGGQHGTPHWVLGLGIRSGLSQGSQAPSPSPSGGLGGHGVPPITATPNLGEMWAAPRTSVLTGQPLTAPTQPCGAHRLLLPPARCWEGAGRESRVQTPPKHSLAHSLSPLTHTHTLAPSIAPSTLWGSTCCTPKLGTYQGGTHAARPPAHPTVPY